MFDSDAWHPKRRSASLSVDLHVQDFFLFLSLPLCAAVINHRPQRRWIMKGWMLMDGAFSCVALLLREVLCRSFISPSDASQLKWERFPQALLSQQQQRCIINVVVTKKMYPVLLFFTYILNVVCSVPLLTPDEHIWTLNGWLMWQIKREHTAVMHQYVRSNCSWRPAVIFTYVGDEWIVVDSPC